MQSLGWLQAKLRNFVALVPGYSWPAGRSQSSCSEEVGAVHQAAGLSRQAINSTATILILQQGTSLMKLSFAGLVWCLLGLLCLQRRQPSGLQGLYGGAAVELWLMARRSTALLSICLGHGRLSRQQTPFDRCGHTLRKAGSAWLLPRNWQAQAKIACKQVPSKPAQ